MRAEMDESKFTARGKLRLSSLLIPNLSLRLEFNFDF
jgi:hypothetical protein